MRIFRLVLCHRESPVLILRFKDVKARVAVRTEIINTIIDHLFDVYGGIGRPGNLTFETKLYSHDNQYCVGVKVMRDVVVDVMKHQYPAMFYEAGEGL